MVWNIKFLLSMVPFQGTNSFMSEGGGNKTLWERKGTKSFDFAFRMGKDESVASERPRKGSPARLAMEGRMWAHLSADKKNNKKWGFVVEAIHTPPKSNTEPENDETSKRNLLCLGLIFRFHIKPQVCNWDEWRLAEGFKFQANLLVVPTKNKHAAKRGTQQQISSFSHFLGIFFLGYCIQI